MGVLHGFLSSCFLFLALQTVHCATVVVDGVSKWSNPRASIGDTIIFKHKNEYNVYIFRSKEAYNTCNFTHATPLSNPNSTTYTWHPSRPGNYYFAFYNGTNKPCQNGQKLAVEVTPLSNSPPTAVQPTIPPEISPPASPGGVISSSPAYPWPFHPREKATAAEPAAADFGISPEMSPSGLPGNIPFINSNPAVPLPTGEVDSATIGPLPTAANQAPQVTKTFGFIRGLMYICFVIMIII
ncbi:hypothetical protein RND81_03G063800 [Saponaria officinalis]|uniref:Phytocyanin domain-containing protein n=1 Tax=Saponaria officinalis TaxID=3572 RepID=A0AAW1M880_SAPOF